MTEPIQKGKYELSDLGALELRVGSIFDDYYGDGSEGGDDNGRCQELSDRLHEINDRLADPLLLKDMEIALLQAMMRITAQLRHPPCGGVVLRPS